MTKYLLVAVAVAAIAFSSAAFAEDAKSASTQAAASKAMTDAEMDRVTAGTFVPSITTRTQEVFPHWSDRGANQAVTNGFKGHGDPAADWCCVSDRRLKRDIIQVGRLDNGLVLYRYRYKWSDQVYVGVMAQEVELVRPDAIVRGADGYLRVDYSRLGLHLMTWEEWVASPFKTAQNATTATAPKAMSDSELDRVTAGQPGFGVFTAGERNGKSTPFFAPGLGRARDNAPNPIFPGCGQGTRTGCAG
jgi:Chaperone of endosialidase